jgi:hypothetical protein
VDANAKKLETLRRLGAKICSFCNTIGQESQTCQVCRARADARTISNDVDRRFQRQMEQSAQRLAAQQNKLALKAAMEPNTRAYRRQVLDHAEDIREAMGDWDMGNGLFGGNPID